MGCLSLLLVGIVYNIIGINVRFPSNLVTQFFFSRLYLRVRIKNLLIKGIQTVGLAVSATVRGAEKLEEITDKALKDNKKWADEGMARLEEEQRKREKNHHSGE